MSVAGGMSESKQWPGGWIQVKVPLPFSLRWVNSYLIPGRDGVTLVDPGLHTPEASACWERVMAQYGIGMPDIRLILITHQHPDHYGLAGWFQQRTGAPVMMSRLSYAYTQRLWGNDRRFGESLVAMYAEHGMPQELLALIGPHLESFVERVSPQPEITFLELSGSIRFGDREWEIIHTPGHAEGHLCFYDRLCKTMLCGDQVLPDITPNISVVPDGDDNPLLTFLSSLKQLRKYEVEFAWPGHRDPFSGFSERIEEIIGHHERRLAAIRRWLEEPLSAYEVFEKLFGQRVKGNVHNLRFAMSETLAHLYYLAGQGEAIAFRHNGQWSYRIK
ncbi:MBL fold metallo-hydrolase [Paenibacillus tarimensis]